jgi:phage protein D
MFRKISTLADIASEIAAVGGLGADCAPLHSGYNGSVRTKGGR